MLRNYLKTAFRELVRFKTNSTINLIGLALALASLLLIFLWMHDELTYDHHHKNADRIFKLNSRIHTADNFWHVEVTPTAWGPTLADEYAEIESAARVSNRRDITFGLGSRYEIESDFVWADSTIFGIFTLPVLAGTPTGALAAPFTVAITKDVADRYWKRPEDAIGQVVSINGRDLEYEVTAVVANQPRNSLLNVRGFISMATLYTDRHPRPRPFNFQSHYDNTFLLAADGTRAEDIEELMPGFLARHIDADVMQRNRYEPEAIALKDVHLQSRVEELAPPGNSTRIKVIAVVGLVILAIAVANFVNLTMAHLARRLSDFGLRKILGATRRHIIVQMVFQASLIAMAALILATICVEFSLGIVNDITGKALQLSAAEYASFAIFSLVVVVIIALSAAIPVFLLSWSRPMKFLTGRQLTSRRSTGVRSVLVTFQFGISLALLLATITVFRQTAYLQSEDVGFEPQRLVTFDTTDAIRASLPAFLLTLRQDPSVVDATACFVLPSVVTVARSYSVGGESTEERQLLATYYIDEHFIPAMGLDLVEGRNFSSQVASDSTSAFIVNEAFLRSMGWETAAGKHLRYFQGNLEEDGPIIGVVRDFTQTSLHSEIAPCVLQIEADARNYNVVARIHDNRRSDAIVAMQSAWGHFEHDRPFSYRFYDDIIVEQYASEKQLGNVILAFTFLAIAIACLGLFALVAFKTEQARKEIGLRKVLGASTIDIATLLSRDFLRIFAIAALIALPGAHYAMERWLSDFAHRIDISILSYIISVGVVLIVVLSTANAKAYTAARANPVDSLRHE